MTKPRFLLTTLLGYAAIVVAIIFLDMTMYKAPLFGIPNDFLTYYAIGFGCIILIIAYFICVGRKDGIKINWVVTSCVLILFSCSLIAILRQPESQNLYYGNKSITVNFTIEEKLTYILQSVVFLLPILVLVHILEKKKFSYRSFHWVYYVLIIIALVGVIYSLIAEWDKYVYIFTEKEIEKYPSIASCFGNENIYSFVLIFAMLAIFVIYEIRKHWWLIPLYIIFFIALIFTTSLSSIICALLLTLFIIIYSSIKSYKKSLIKMLFKVGASVIGLTAVLITFDSLVKANVSFFVSLDAFIKNAMLKKDFSTLTQRTYIWEAIWILVSQDPGTLLCGRGYGMSMRLLDFQAFLTLNEPLENMPCHAHNGYLDILLTFGFLGIAIYLAGLIYYIKSSICMIKHGNKSVAISCLICTFVLLFYSCFEDVYAFKTTISGIPFVILFLFPAINFYQKYKKTETYEGEKKLLPKKHVFAHSLDSLILNISIVTFFIGCASFLFNKIYVDNYLLTTNIVLVIISGLSILMYPLLRYKERTNKIGISIGLVINLITQSTLYTLFMTNIIDSLWLYIFVPISYLVIMSLTFLLLREKLLPKFKDYIASFKCLSSSGFYSLAEAIVLGSIYFLICYFYKNQVNIYFLISLNVISFALIISFIYFYSNSMINKGVESANDIYLRYELHENELERRAING